MLLQISAGVWPEVGADMYVHSPARPRRGGLRVAVRRGLGTPSPTGTPLPSFGLANMAPGACCYDPSRPSWMPAWWVSPEEHACISQTDNCSGQVQSIPVGVPATTACAGTLNADGSCTQVSGVNDPFNTQGGLATNGADFAAQWQAFIDNMRNGATSPPVDTGSVPLWVWAVIAGAVVLGAGLLKGGR